MTDLFRKKLKQWLNYIGLWVDADSSLPYSYNGKDYINTKEKKVITHKQLLLGIEKKENERLTIIETKTSQIITFTGIIFSGLSLFIPIMLDKIADQQLYIKVIFIIVLVMSFTFYFLTINNAVRNYNIGKFVYSGSDPNNVIKYQNESVTKFTSIEIQDLLYYNNQNLKTNNDKANNLIYSYRTFRIANFMTAILGILLCISFLFFKQKEKSITITNPVQIQRLPYNQH